MNRLIIEDGTQWPDPSDQSYSDLAYKLTHDPFDVGRHDMLEAASVMQAYRDLITHPAFTLKRVQEKVSGIRKEIKYSKEKL